MRQGLGYGHLGGSPCLAIKPIPWNVAHQAPVLMGFPRQENWSGSHFLLQGTFTTMGWKLCLLHWQADSVLMSHQGSPWTCWGLLLSLPQSQSTVHKWTITECPMDQLVAVVVADCHACPVCVLFFLTRHFHISRGAPASFSHFIPS